MKLKITTILALMLLPMMSQAQRQQIHGCILLVDRIIDIELAPLLSICIGRSCVGDVVYLLILLTLRQ